MRNCTPLSLCRRICRRRGERRGHFRWFEERCLFGDGREAGQARWNGGPEGKPGCMECGQDLENLEFPVQNFKIYPRSNRKPWSFGSNLERNSGAGNFTSGRRLTETGPGAFQLCSTETLGNLLGHQRGPDWRWEKAGILASPHLTRKPLFYLFSVYLCLLCKILLEERSSWDETF